MNKFQQIIVKTGQSNIARACKKSRQAVGKWLEHGKLPRTEYLPVGDPDKTYYADSIAKLAGCKRSDLL